MSWRDVISATRAESLDRYPGGVHPQGRPWHQRGEGLEPRGSPPTAGRGPPRKGSIGIRGAWSSEGRAKATDPRGGEGTPRRDPGGPADRSRPNGRVGGHQRATATAATAYLWRRSPAHWTSHGAARPHRASHGVPRPKWGAGARGDPRDNPGEPGVVARWPKGGAVPSGR